MDHCDPYLTICLEAVRAGGRVIQDWAGRFDVRHKGPADLVTQADFASQETVRQIVLGAFPDHAFLGEEKEPHVPSHQRADYRWVVDPLDGTMNYVHGVPHYCVSLALEHHGQPIVGAVYDPNLDECFAAVAGRGATLNDRPIHTSNVSSLSDALAAVGFPAHAPQTAPDLALFQAMIPRCQAIRRTGSSALNLCYLAAGRFDVYWSYSTRIWDVAAGVLILREAGGHVSSPSGGAFVLEDAHFLAAANPNLHQQLLSVAKEIAG